jgi:PAS domain S-box-containing protein
MQSPANTDEDAARCSFDGVPQMETDGRETDPQSNSKNTVAALILQSAAATLVVLTAILLGHAAPALPGLDPQWLFFLFSVILAAWYLGTAPTTAAVFAGPLLASVVIHAREAGGFGLSQGGAIPSYFLIGMIVTVLIHALRRSQRRALKMAAATRQQAESLQREIQKRRCVESDLREREARLRLILENVRGVAIFSLDPEGGVNDWNSAAEKICGLAKEEILGQHVSRLFPREGGVKFEQGLLRTADKKCCAVHKGWHPGKEGDVYLHTVTCAKYDQTGRRIGYLMIALDLTDQANAQEALRQSEERFRHLFQFAAVGIAQLDSEGRFLDANGTLCQITGYSLEELRTKTFLDITIPEDREMSRAEFAKIRNGEMPFLQREKRYVHKDGRILWGHVTASFLRDAEGNPQRTISVVEEITARKEAEAALELANDRLAQQAKALERMLAERTAKLQHSLQDIEGFCSSIAHNLRAPLRAMSGFTQVLMDDYAPSLDVTAAGYCKRINTAARRMDRLIFDLLSYERLAYLELRMQPVELEQALQQVLEGLVDQVQTRHGAVEVENALPKVCGDTSVLYQVLQQLIDNAVKFVPSDRAPRVRIHAERRASTVRLWIEDNGTGIPPEFQNRIFGVFERLPATPFSDMPGTGIGLAIVRRGVELMGGNCGVESQIEHGSRFWIELPEPVNEMIDDETVADAILDRLVHNAYRVELKGESLRKTSKG